MSPRASISCLSCLFTHSHLSLQVLGWSLPSIQLGRHDTSITTSIRCSLARCGWMYGLGALPSTPKSSACPDVNSP